MASSSSPFSLSQQPTIIEPPNTAGPDAFDPARIEELLQKNPVDEASPASCGTAGFRQAANDALRAIVTRTGAVAVVRSLQFSTLSQSQTTAAAVGVMITASHNDESYNGVKMADPSGGMLAPDGEAMAVTLANQGNVTAALQWITQQLNDNKNNNNIRPVVHVGRDTRSHSAEYRQCLVDMITATGGIVVDHGVCTTPMLHHAVLHANYMQYLPSLIPPRFNVGGYLELLASSYVALCATATTTTPRPPLLVDCACGVGYPALVELIQTLQSTSDPNHNTFKRTKMFPANAPGSGPLNEQCGSEHVQKAQEPPTWYSTTDDTNTTMEYCAALDGDADRIVFFSQSSNSSNNKFQLLDGDKIACLFCQFIQEQLSALESYLVGDGDDSNTLICIRLGVVQTAYANGASTKVLRQLLGVENVLIAKTGVKHVHEAAHDNFDIGVYFEANGHGTILFGPHFYQAVALVESRLRQQTAPSASNAAAAVALKRLQLLPALVNQAVGDALSDLLLVDAILLLQGRSLQDWYAMYQDLPSRQSKVKVPDRNMIKTNDNETKCIAPVGLQQDLDKAMQQACPGGGRAFVRPSGTEDVVRVYAEASTQEAANALAQKAQEIVQRFTSPSKI